MMDDDSTDRNVREAERRRITGVPRATWWRWEKKGKVPRRVKLFDDGRGVCWSRKELLAWRDSLYENEEPFQGAAATEKTEIRARIVPFPLDLEAMKVVEHTQPSQPIRARRPRLLTNNSDASLALLLAGAPTA